MKLLGDLYNRLWFATEFWLTPVDRRPFTFIMRDYIFQHPWRAVPMIIAWYAGMGILLFYCAPAAAILIGMSAFVLAHVVWGSKWIENQQEYPTYLGE